MANTYKQLATYTVGAGGIQSVVFSDIPQTYTDLVVVASARGVTGTPDLAIAFNGATSSTQDSVLYYVGASTTGSNTSASYIRASLNASASTANTFNSATYYIPDYASNVSSKSVIVNSTAEENGTTNNGMFLTTGLFYSNDPITSVVLYSAQSSQPNAFTFAQYSTFTLYGVFNSDTNAVPSAPTIGTATAGAGSASVPFTGVSNVASYVVTSNPSSITATGTTSPIVVSNLTGGTAYTFTVKAQNPLGISASSVASNSVTPTATAYESIATTTVGAGGQSTITFSSIPSTYKHLQIRANWAPSTGAYLKLNINSDSTGSNYYSHSLFGNGTTGGTSNLIGSSYPFVVMNGAVGVSTNKTAATVIEFLDYTITNKTKTLRALTGFDANGTGCIELDSAYYAGTSAISTLTFGLSGGSFNQYTKFALYGIRG